MEVCISSATGMEWCEVSTRSPFLLFISEKPLSCLGHADEQASWGIEQKEVAECLTNGLTKGICHNASLSVPPRRLPPGPFPLSCLLPLITEFTSRPTGEQKGHFRFAAKEVFIEEKTLTCMQTVTAAVKVILTHGSKVWGMEMGKQCRRQPGPP